MNGYDQRGSCARAFDPLRTKEGHLNFEVGGAYSRETVQILLGVPEAQRNGAWDTGYNRFAEALYVFCNVGSAGRTGHDYDNHWEDEELIWYAKTSTHLRQPLMRAVVDGDVEIHLFWRENSAQPIFFYAGQARIAEVLDTTPVKFRFGFDRPSRARVAPPKTKTLGDVLLTDSRIFAKSEFGPVSDGWPALSFSSRKIAADFSREFRAGKDFVLYVGTGQASATENPAHRSRVLSAISFEPNAPISTRQIVSDAAWEGAVDVKRRSKLTPDRRPILTPLRSVPGPAARRVAVS